jgi:hypothetical protein
LRSCLSTAAACQEGVIIFNTESCTIFALDAGTGKQLWSLWLGDPLTNTPTIANGKVFTAYPAQGRAAPTKEAPAAPAAKANRPLPPCSHVLQAGWLVTGTNGENLLRAEAAGQAEAWWRACEQARAVGMLAQTREIVP